LIYSLSSTSIIFSAWESNHFQGIGSSDSVTAPAW
jgi:hypothetical protein